MDQLAGVEIWHAFARHHEDFPGQLLDETFLDERLKGGVFLDHQDSLGRRGHPLDANNILWDQFAVHGPQAVDDDVISHVSQNMPSDCVLFVMGDHGMTMTGDHGGDSRDEVSAALFVYSKANGQSKCQQFVKIHRRRREYV